MTTVHRTAIVSYSTQQMFCLVNDVVRYPEFLPWCRSSAVLSESETQLTGSIEVSRMGVHKTFTTNNALTPYDKIELSLVDGPFKKLSGVWEFTALNEQACEVALHLEYGLTGSWVDAAFGAVFKHIATTMVDAFCQRASEVYGKDQG
jgi:ribosome-associated toxin RatA of RatAB toxin-antitoxin module